MDGSDFGARSPWTLRFGDRALEASFLDYHSALAALHQRIASVVGSLVFVAGIAWVGWLTPDLQDDATRFFLLGPVPVLALTFALSFRRELSDTARQLTAFIDLAATSGAVLALLIRAPTVSSGPFGSDGELTFQVAGVPALFLVILVTVTYVRMRFLWSLGVTPMLVAAYLVAADQAGNSGTVTAANTIAFIGATGFGVSLSYLLEAGTRTEWIRQLEVEHERQRADDLLHNILPRSIVARVKAGEEHIADRHDAATVVFADLVGFTPLADALSAQEVVDLLARLMAAFDGVADRHGLEKIKTIGDAYMAVAGAPEPCADHADRALAASGDLLAATSRLGAELGMRLEVRIGLDSGPLVAGIIGVRKLAYDLWGDTVNTASRMESHGVAGAVQLTDATRAALAHAPAMEERSVEVKGKGEMRTWLWRPAGAVDVDDQLGIAGG